jgi:hypothetical protein
MKYATWKLKFDNPKYGKSPETGAQDVILTGAYLLGDAKGGTIVGYVHGDASQIDLSLWDYQEVTQDKALSLVQVVYEDAFIDESGQILIPTEPIPPLENTTGES